MPAGPDRGSPAGPAEWFIPRTGPEAPLVPLVGDCSWSVAWPKAMDRTPPDLQNGDRAQQAGLTLTPTFGARPRSSSAPST